MTAITRRVFLRAAGWVTSIAWITGKFSLRAASPPLPPAPGAGLKIIEGDGLLDLPAGATGRLGSPRMRVAGYLNAIRFGPRGNVIIAASGEELRAWDPRSGKVLFRFRYPEQGSVSAGGLTTRDTLVLLFQPNNGNTHEIRHYAFGTGKQSQPAVTINLGNTQHTAFSHDGSLFAVVRTEGLHLFDTKDGKEKWHDALPAQAVGDCVFFPDGSAVAIAGRGEIKVYAVATGKVTSNLKSGLASNEPNGGRGKDWISSIVVSPDGKWVAASIGEDGDAVYCWAIPGGELKHKLKASKPLGFSPDGSELCTISEGAATFWTMATGKSGRSFDVPANRDLLLSPDGKILAAEAGDAALLIDAATGKHLPHSADPPGLPDSLQFVGTRLIGRLGEWGGWIEWSSKPTTATLVRPSTTRGTTPISLSLDRKVALYRKKDDYQVVDVATGKIVSSAKSEEAFNENAAVATITPDGRTLVVAKAQGIALVSAAGEKPIKHTQEIARVLVATAVSADGRTAASVFRGEIDKTVADIYDLATARFVRRLSVEGEATHVALSSDGSSLALSLDQDRRGRGGQRGAVSILDTQTGRVILHIPPDDYSDLGMALSPCGRMLARHESKKNEKDPYRIAIWDVLGGGIRSRFESGGSSSAMAFALDCRTFAASVSGGPVFLWDLHAATKDADPGDLDKAWADLRSPDAAVAFIAIKTMTRAAEMAVKLLREKLVPVVPPDVAKVNRFIADLDHKEFRRRETAMRELAELGDRVHGPLRVALAAKPAPEARERIDRLLAAQDRSTPDQLRRLRAIEAMETAGSPTATQLLQEWASGAPGALFTREAAAALKRLAARGSL